MPVGRERVSCGSWEFWRICGFGGLGLLGWFWGKIEGEDSQKNKPFQILRRSVDVNVRPEVR